MMLPRGRRKREARAIGKRPRMSLSYRTLIWPYGLADSPWGVPVGALLIAILGCLAAIEFLTPHVVVGALAVLPILAALWLLSTRAAAAVITVAMLLFVAAVVIEPANRLSLLVMGAALSATAATARWYAGGLAVVLKTQALPPLTTPDWESDKRDRLPWGGRFLTSREEDVARLAIAGYRSAEIAQRLHIGRRTVESHLAGVYSKLGIRSRLQLITMAAASSITSPEQHRQTAGEARLSVRSAPTKGVSVRGSPRFGPFRFRRVATSWVGRRKQAVQHLEERIAKVWK